MIVVRWCEDAALVRRLAALEGIAEARLGRGCTLALCRADTLVLPDDIPPPDQILVRAAEEGGGASNTGHCQVVCDPAGRPLPPVDGRCCGYALGVHAIFEAAALTVVRISRTRAGTICRILIISVQTNGRKIERLENELWCGPVTDLPLSFSHYEAAVAAAVQKSRCYHCRHSHYYAE